MKEKYYLQKQEGTKVTKLDVTFEKLFEAKAYLDGMREMFAKLGIEIVYFGRNMLQIWDDSFEGCKMKTIYIKKIA